MAKAHITILNMAKAYAMPRGRVTALNRLEPTGYRITRDELDRFFAKSGWKPGGRAAERAIKSWVNLGWVFEEEGGYLLLCSMDGEWPI